MSALKSVFGLVRRIFGAGRAHRDERRFEIGGPELTAILVVCDRLRDLGSGIVPDRVTGRIKNNGDGRLLVRLRNCEVIDRESRKKKRKGFRSDFSLHVSPPAGVWVVASGEVKFNGRKFPIGSRKSA